MIAVTPTNTEYHPRGSGPSYGTQFQRIRDAWERIREYGSGKVRWALYADVEVELWLWCETERENSMTINVAVVPDIESEGYFRDFEFWGIDVEESLAHGEVESYDDLVRLWWDNFAQGSSHPWDPNGIVEARRLGLKRVENPDWYCDWGGLHETDKLSFEAYDNGDFERMPIREVWNKVNQIGMRWS